MERLNYNDRMFRLVSNLGPGDVDQETVFFYHQKDNYLWGHYQGGNVTMGVLIGKVLEDDTLKFNYHHYDHAGNIKSGICHSHPQVENNRIILHEEWLWTDGIEGSGTSILEEIINE